ncbi:WbuC family cupin fold metalloprotein [Andreprevotia chitinilytica]|uniref:WbuC family cupin fold metalloprotein n=1 Tax=Andreprevotia chitinilytica TaxID=396808 RepID=UPI001B800234|nr:WbuC family cupin fold metalloprotein [Andreprevotia chitinilytica]
MTTPVLKQLTRDDLARLGDAARQSPRLRANQNFHPVLEDPIQRLAIAMQPRTYVRPHRHPHTFELLFPLVGRFVVLHFDAAGVVTRRTVLGEGSAILETPAGEWHAVLSLDDGGVIFEVKHGPYTPIAPEDYTAWSPAEGTSEAEALMDWYAIAQVGERFSAP